MYTEVELIRNPQVLLLISIMNIHFSMWISLKSIECQKKKTKTKQNKKQTKNPKTPLIYYTVQYLLHNKKRFI
jgi:hypothetical protein